MQCQRHTIHRDRIRCCVEKNIHPPCNRINNFFFFFWKLIGVCIGRPPDLNKNNKSRGPISHYNIKLFDVQTMVRFVADTFSFFWKKKSCDHHQSTLLRSNWSDCIWKRGEEVPSVEFTHAIFFCFLWF